MVIRPSRHDRFHAAFLAIAVLVLGLGACAAIASDPWLHTRNGWERTESVHPAKVVYEPALHPLIVTAWVALSSTWALMAFERAES